MARRGAIQWFIGPMNERGVGIMQVRETALKGLGSPVEEAMARPSDGPFGTSRDKRGITALRSDAGRSMMSVAGTDHSIT